jgi:hypothetical protein
MVGVHFMEESLPQAKIVFSMGASHLIGLRFIRKSILGGCQDTHDTQRGGAFL